MTYLAAKCGRRDCSPCANSSFYERDLIDYTRKYLDTRRLLMDPAIFWTPRIIDAGAHTGLWAVALSDHCRASFNGRPEITAIEPVPDNFFKLQVNAGFPDETGIIPYDCAAWYRRQRLTIDINQHPARAHVETKAVPNDVFVSIWGIPIDELVGKNASIDFMKIDVEGAEYKTLLGAEGTLARSDRMLVCVELSIEHLARFGDTPKDIVNLMTYHKFRLARECDEHIVARLTKGRIGKVFFQKG